MKKLIAVAGLGAAVALGSLVGCGTAQAGNDSYNRGHDAGSGSGLALQTYHLGGGKQGACLSAYQADLMDLAWDGKPDSISKTDYFRGCYDALGDA